MVRFDMFWCALVWSGSYGGLRDGTPLWGFVRQGSLGVVRRGEVSSGKVWLGQAVAATLAWVTSAWYGTAVPVGCGLVCSGEVRCGSAVMARQREFSWGKVGYGKARQSR